MRKIILTLILVLSCPRNATAQTPSFTGLGDLPGSDHYSFAHGVSSGGRVVVGFSETARPSFGGHEAFRWTIDEGIQPLVGPQDDSVTVAATDVTDDGHHIVGYTASPTGGEAFVWSTGRGYVGLGHIQGFENTRALGVASGGTVVVGFASNAGSDIEAVRWTSSGGWQRLGRLPGAGPILQSNAYDVSADGAVVVGSSYTGSRWEAFRWTESAGMHRLEDEFASTAEAVSPDARVIAGTMYVRREVEENRGVLWFDDGSILTLGFLPGRFPETYPKGLSRDGSIVVGTAAAGYGFFHEDRAFIWDSAHGIRDLQDVLVNGHGLDLSGWTLEGAWDISPDGTAIVGYGLNPAGHTEAWLAIIPDPTTLPTLAATATLLIRPKRTGKQRPSPRTPTPP